MCIGVSPIIILGNVLNVPPALAFLLLFSYMGAGILIIGNYCIAHQDEIPTRAERRQGRGR
jgi:hypothetical protein